MPWEGRKVGKTRRALNALMLGGAVMLAACGGGGGGGAGGVPDPVDRPADPPIIKGTGLPADVHWQPPAGSTPASGNYVYLDSAEGDSVGQGRPALYTERESTLSHFYAEGQYQFRIGSTERQWSGAFQLGYDYPPRAGFYGDAALPGRGDGQQPWLEWMTEWRFCARIEGWFVIDEISVGSDGLETITARFAQRCDGSTGSLRGKLRWSRAVAHSGPIDPVPALWQPPAGTTPATGSFLYVESDAADYVGQGVSRLFTTVDSTLSVGFYDTPFAFYSVVARSGFDTWNGNLRGMVSPTLQRGYHPGVQRYPYQLDGVGVMEWQRNGRGCGTVNGWFVVDDVVYVGQLILYIELRFEQRCGLSAAVSRGKLRWSAFDVQPAPGPQTLPGSSWQPPEGSTPASGDFVYLESETGDSVGQGRTLLATSANASLQGTPFGASFHLRAEQGGAAWVGDFRAMNSRWSLEPGFYPSLSRHPLHDPKQGGLSWSVESRACAALDGWVAIDELVNDADGSVASIVMRFEQRCAGDTGALRGKLRWSAASQAIHLATMPAGLWQAPPERLPAAGNYIYVESDLFDPIGRGGTAVRNSESQSTILALGGTDPLTTPTVGFGIAAHDDRDRWGGRFVMPPEMPQLLPGLYGNLRGNIEGGSVRGSMSWTGSAINCDDDASGWYAIDQVTYNGTFVESIDMRFEQRCGGFDGSLRGKIRWSANEPPPAVAAAPIPAELWKPPAGATPESGNFLYLESQYGDYVGVGRTMLFTADNAQLAASMRNPSVGFRLDATERGAVAPWSAGFEGIPHLQTLQPGFFDRAVRSVSRSQLQPGIDISGSNRGCNSASGWYAVDSLSISNGEITAIELRFEQHCDRRSAPLRGKLRWSAAA